jgi:hypothetical protein
MNNTTDSSGLDQGFLLALGDGRTSATPTASPKAPAAASVRVRFTTNDSSPVVAAFNPGATEKALRTQALNETARLGFRSPKASTR